MVVFSNFSDLARLGTHTLIAGTLTATSWASLAAVDLCGSMALADHSTLISSGHEDFGRDGRDGRDGSTGRNGRDGTNQTIWATGAPLQLDLSGTDGDDGTRGQDAERFRCRRQPRDLRHDLEAADGGDGGDGGHGGSGGNGGTLTVHYTDPSALRQILVNAQGGQGGRGGLSGLGIDGCECDDRSWTVEVCTDGTCQQNEYECKDGSDGSDGSDGRTGTAGSLGQLVLINQVDPLPSETPRQSQSVTRLANAPVTLSRNLWETRSGATNLLAPGSSIDSTFQAYTGHIERQFALDWQAPQSAQTFTDAIDLELQPNGDVSIDFPDTYWLLGEMLEQEARITYRVDGMIPVAEVTRLAVGQVDGRSRTFAINVVDLAQKSDILETRFEVRYSTANNGGRRRRYSLDYEGTIPADLIQQDHNRFTLALGRLPIRSQLLSGGTDARVELKIIRSYGNNSAEQTLTWEGEI